MDGLGRATEGLIVSALDPIAIVGAACRLPGAPDLAAFERLLFGGGDAVGQVPESRWATYRFLHPERGQAGKTYSFAAGLLDAVDQFDHGFFGISPREAASMDPQQRLMLELAHEALEDAGLDGGSLAGTRVGVYVGGSSWDYLTLHTGDPSALDAYSMTGATLCSLANRVSYAMDLRGPSMTMDTACSSSLVALHQACEAIRSGQVPVAMVGGVSLLLAPQSFVGFSAASMLSPTGRCHAFDARADGYVRAEGGAMVVLRPLRDALAAGDTIHALIRGTGVNSDGRTTGFSLPNKVAQAELLRDVYGRFGIDPEELCYVEAHGTGTPAGDPIEATALGEALGRGRTHPLPIGSVKTNIGHLEAASGLAGLLKAVIALRRGTVPASLHCQTPNPAIPFADLNLRLLPDALPIPTGQRRLAGVNSFGFGGTNAHAVIEAVPADAWPTMAVAEASDAPVPLLLSARSKPALRALASAWEAMLAADAADAELIRAAAVAREAHVHRIVVNGSSPAKALADWLAERGNHDLVAGEAVTGGVAFVFSGNGSQWAGMGLDAAEQNPAFRDALSNVDGVLAPLLGWSVCDRLREADADTLRDTTVAQPLLFAVQVATVQALRRNGIDADFFFGHSVGEVAAAWAARALQLEQACRVIAVRSRLQALTTGDGRMGVAGLPPDRVAELLAGTKLEIAASNAATATTVAGPAGDIAALALRAKREGWAFAAMDLEHAYHSAAMDPIQAPLLAELAGLSPAPCPATFISTAAGGSLPAGSRLDAAYWWRNVRDPVRFAEAASTCVALGGRILVEIGPQAVLQAYLHDALRTADVAGRVVPSLTRRTPAGRDPIATAAARCHVAGCDMRGAAVFAGPRRHRGLPAYPWQRERHWVTRTAESIDSAEIPAEHPLLGARLNPAEALAWSNHLGPALQPWLADHVIGGAVVAPAAMLAEMALAAARARHPAAAGLQVLDLEISRPLTFEAGMLREVRLRVSAAAGGFEITSRPRLSRDPWTVHATGRLAADSAEPARAVPGALAQVERTDGPALYRQAAALGLSYGPAFQVVAEVATAGSIRADVILVAPGTLPAGMILPPTLLDGAFQGLVALAAGLLPAGDGVVPWRFGRVRLLRPAGTVPASARLTVTRVGPRSVRADLHLVDDAGAAVAELLDCWFVQVPVGARSGAGDGGVFHVASVPSTAGWAPALAGESLAEVLGPLPSEPDQACLLADAFMAAVAEEWVRSALPAADAAFTPAALAAPGARDRCDEVLGWLSADGLAEAADGTWRLSEPGPSADDVLGTLVFDTPGAVADAAMLADAAARLVTELRTGEPGLAAGVTDQPALSDHFLHASPGGQAACRALIAGAVRVAGSWPAGRPLRVLQLGALRGTFSKLLLTRLAQEGVATHLHALTDAAGQPALASTLARFPDARALAWPTAEELGQYDLIIGLCPFSLGLLDTAELPALLQAAPGGLVMLAEPGSSRLWSVVIPQAATRLLDGPGWAAVLTEAGGTEAGCVPVGGGWNGNLVAARLPEPLPAMAEALSTVLLAVADDPIAEELAHQLGALGPVHRAMHGPCARVVLLPDPDATVADALDALTRCVAKLPEAARLTLVTRDGPTQAALAGLRRVIANERPDVSCRHVCLSADLPDAEAAAHAAREVTAPDDEAEVTWSQAGRTVPRLRQGVPSTAAAAAGTPLRLSVARFGLLDSIGWDRLAATPQPGAGQIGIRVRAAGLNFRDVMWGMGMLPDEALIDGFAGPLLGLECAGEVTAVGDGVDGFAPGDRVMAFAPASLATHTVTAAHAAVRMPDDMSFAAAATVPVAFLTVAYALGHLARLEPGESVLVHGGAGGVGLAAIQFARLRGATVFATAGTPAKRAMLQRLGVAAVLDSRGLGFADELLRMTGGEGVDVVLNSLSGDAMEASLKLLRPYGRFLELGKRDFYGNTAIGLRPLRQNIAYFGVDVDVLPLRQPRLAAALLAEVAGLLRDGSLRPLPFRQYEAAEVEDAFRLMQGSGHIGKIVLGFDGPLVPRRAAPAATVRSDRTYLVTGGLDGFGLQAATWLAQQGARHIALLGRRGGATPGADAALESLRSLGASAEAYACDVADEAALAAVLDAVRAGMPPLAGVVHAAVAMDDGLLPDMDAARFARALAPKLGGALALDRLTRTDPVELFVLFSSVTSVLGNPGQANYVAANTAAEAVVIQRHREGLPGLAVQWGPIGDAGYLTRQVGVAKMLSKRLGGRLLGAQDALAALPALLAVGLPVVGLANVRWDRLGAGLPLLATPMFEAVRGDGGEPAGEVDLAELLASCTPEVAQAKLTELLAEEVARIMRTSPASILPHRPLAELGMDSLMAVELRLAVEQRFGLSVPVLALSDGATLSALAGRMARTAAGASSPRTEIDQLEQRMRRFEPVAEPVVA